MILINDNWWSDSNVLDLLRIVRECYNPELADKLEGLIPKFSDDDYYDLISEIDTFQKDLDVAESVIDSLREKIYELREKVK